MHALTMRLVRAQIGETLEDLRATVKHTLVPPTLAEPPVAMSDTIAATLSELSSSISTLEATARSKDVEGASLREELGAARACMETKAAELAAEAALRRQTEVDAADVADSLLTADQTIDQLTAQVEAQQTEAETMAAELMAARAAADDHAAALAAATAAREATADVAAKEAVAVRAAFEDLASSLAAVCAHSLPAPARPPPRGGFGGGAGTGSRERRAAGGGEVAGSVAKSSGGGWLGAARRAWASLDSLSSGLPPASEHIDSTVLRAALHAADDELAACRAELCSAGERGNAADATAEALRRLASDERAAAAAAEASLASMLRAADDELREARREASELQADSRAQLMETMEVVQRTKAQLDAYAYACTR